jgi:hypothetical protein
LFVGCGHDVATAQVRREAHRTVERRHGRGIDASCISCIILCITCINAGCTFLYFTSITCISCAIRGDANFITRIRARVSSNAGKSASPIAAHAA